MLQYREHFFTIELKFCQCDSPRKVKPQTVYMYDALGFGLNFEA